MSLSQSAGEGQSSKRAPWKALWQVVTDPVGAYAQLGPKPPVLPGYLFAMVVGLVVTGLTVPVLLQKTAGLAASSPEMAQAGGFVKTTMVVSAVLANVAVPWVVGLLASLVALLVAQFQGGSAGFSAYMGMIGYAQVPVVLNRLLAGVWARINDGAVLDLSLAVLLPAGANPFLRVLLQACNPFTIWYYVLLAVGFGSLHGKKPKQGAVFSVALFVLAVLLSMATAKMGSGVPQG